MIKVDAAADFPDAVRALVDAGIPVFAQFGLTPQTAQKFGIPYSAQNSPQAQASAEAAGEAGRRRRRCSKQPAPACSTSPTPVRSRAPRW